MVVPINRKQGTHARTVQGLNLKISVQLQPRHSPSLITTKKSDDSEMLVSAMAIWVVDITDTGGVSPEEREHRSREIIHKRKRYTCCQVVAFVLTMASVFFILTIVGIIVKYT